jgi:tetratricopeptide (TPR) repeat protein
VSAKFFSAIILAATGFAQMPPFEGGVSINGEIRSEGAISLSAYYVELYDSRSHTVTDRAPIQSCRFAFSHVTPGLYTVRIVSAPGEQPVLEEYHQLDQVNSMLVLQWPERAAVKPPSGVVSIHELEHPVPKRALRALADAQRFSEAHDLKKAIAELEEAIRIEPTFRDAHTNLGVQLARFGRIPEALEQFEKALEIGPPTVIVYSNLALAHAMLHNFRPAENFARKALALDPENTKAEYILRYASSH